MKNSVKVKDASSLGLERGLDLLESFGFKRVVRDAGFGFGDYAARKWDGNHVTVFLMTADPEEEDVRVNTPVVRAGVTFVNAAETPIDSVEFKGVPTEEKLSSVLDYIKTDTQTVSFEEAKKKIKSYVLETPVSDSRRRMVRDSRVRRRGLVRDSVWSDDPESFFRECSKVAEDVLPESISYEWIEDDHSDGIRFWLNDTKEVYWMLWLSDMSSVEEFGDRLEKEAARLTSYLPIAMTEHEALTYEDVYAELYSELGVASGHVALNDFRMWWSTQLFNGQWLTFMAEGNDLDGDNFDLAEAVEDRCGVRALTALAGVSGILVRLSEDERQMNIIDEWYMPNPLYQDLHAACAGIAAMRAQTEAGTSFDLDGYFTSEHWEK